MIDTHLAGDMLGAVPEKRAASRYETVIATLIGLLAVSVSAYTAYMQRQQVRAAVWPILEFGTSNDPDIHLTLSNKGVGPAIIRRVIVKVDDRAVRKWDEAFDRMLGPGKHSFAESDMNGRVLAADESVTILTPWDANRNPLTFNRSNPLWIQLDENRKGSKSRYATARRLANVGLYAPEGPHKARQSRPDSVPV